MARSGAPAMIERISKWIYGSGLCYIFETCNQRIFTMKIIPVLASLVVSVVAFANCQAQTDSKQYTDNTIEIQRRKIDSLDKELIEILGARERAVKEIGIYKAAHKIAPLQPTRFQEVMKKSIAAGANEGLSAEFITKLLNAIHEESLRIEESLRSGNTVSQ
jgi:chorismate mutase